MFEKLVKNSSYLLSVLILVIAVLLSYFFAGYIFSASKLLILSSFSLLLIACLFADDQKLLPTNSKGLDKTSLKYGLEIFKIYATFYVLQMYFVEITIHKSQNYQYFKQISFGDSYQTDFIVWGMFTAISALYLLRFMFFNAKQPYLTDVFFANSKKKWIDFLHGLTIFGESSAKLLFLVVLWTVSFYLLLKICVKNIYLGCAESFFILAFSYGGFVFLQKNMRKISRQIYKYKKPLAITLLASLLALFLLAVFVLIGIKVAVFIAGNFEEHFALVLQQVFSEEMQAEFLKGVVLGEVNCFQVGVFTITYPTALSFIARASCGLKFKKALLINSAVLLLFFSLPANEIAKELIKADECLLLALLFFIWFFGKGIYNKKDLYAGRLSIYSGKYFQGRVFTGLVNRILPTAAIFSGIMFFCMEKVAEMIGGVAVIFILPTVLLFSVRVFWVSVVKNEKNNTC